MASMEPVRSASFLILGAVGVFLGGAAGCAGGQSVVRTLAPQSGSSFGPIVSRAEPLSCKIAIRDAEFPLLILDCPEGRISFGPDSGEPRVTGVETIRRSDRPRPQYLQAECFRGLQSRCQEYAERLLGLPVTGVEQRIPKAPNSLVRPDGHGWHCYTAEFGGIKLPSCYRDSEECMSRQKGQAERGNASQPCVAVERASCFTTGRGHGDWECAATPAECEQARNKGASACGLWE